MLRILVVARCRRFRGPKLPRARLSEAPDRRQVILPAWTLHHPAHAERPEHDWAGALGIRLPQCLDSVFRFSGVLSDLIRCFTRPAQLFLGHTELIA